MSSPVWGWVLAGVYLSVIFVGKRVMASREALSVRPLVLGYNAAMVGLNLYMAVEIFRNAFFVLGYGFRCNGVDYSARGAGMAAVLWWFYASKFIEFLDTIFFVVRKKNGLITFLHLYHHAPPVVDCHPLHPGRRVLYVCHDQLVRPRHHVLVLRPQGSWIRRLVEALPHPDPDGPVLLSHVPRLVRRRV